LTFSTEVGEQCLQGKVESANDKRKVVNKLQQQWPFNTHRYESAQGDHFVQQCTPQTSKLSPMTPDIETHTQEGRTMAEKGASLEHDADLAELGNFEQI